MAIFYCSLSGGADRTPLLFPSLFNTAPLKWRIHALLCWYLIVAQELMVTMRMDYFTDISWSYNFFVWYAFEAVLWIRVFPRMFQKLPTMPSLNGDEEDGTTEEREYFELLIARKEAEADKRKAIESFIWSLCRIIQLIMLGLKLDNECKWGWWAIFWPTYVVSHSLGIDNPNPYNLSLAILVANINNTNVGLLIHVHPAASLCLCTTGLRLRIAQNCVTVHDCEEIPCLC